MADVFKPFWSCTGVSDWPSGLNICELVLETFGFIANLTVTALLFLLHSKQSVADLALLRVLSLSCVASTLISLLNHVVARDTHTGSAFLNGLVCVLWSTRFLYWYSKVQVYHSFFVFAYNRSLGILQLKHYPQSTEKQRRIGYLLLVFIGSFLATAPQLLLAQPHAKNCACAPATENLAILTVIYAHAFLWVAFFGCLYPAGLLCICIALLICLWKRECSSDLVDQLDHLTFQETRSSSTISKLSVLSKSRANPGDGGKGAPAAVDCAWSASFCIIPLTAAYIATFTYDAIYQVLSAAGKLTYVYNSPAQQFAEFLLTLFTSLVPLILFFHIPAMRSLIFVATAYAQTKFGRKMQLADMGGDLA